METTIVKTISIITPCYNEELSILGCIKAIESLFAEKLPEYNYEHIICDNASSDGTLELLRGAARENPRVKVIVNARNFGILKNTYNGVMAATGDAVLLFMPVDLQDPPEMIPEFVRHWEEGYEIVYGLRAKREEGILLRAARKLYYRMLSRLSYVDYPPDAGDFQLIDRRVHDAMKKVSDAQPFMRLMTFDAGFRSIGVKYTWRAREHGKSRNRLRDMVDQGLNGIISFSGAPVRIALMAGFFVALASTIYAMAVIVLGALGKIDAPEGTTTIIAAIFFFGGIQIFLTALIGEYVLATFAQARRKPLVNERERINF